MRLGSPVVLSYLDAGFEPRCGRSDFWGACCCLLLLLLLLLKRVAHPWPLKGGVKPRQGKPSSVIVLYLFTSHHILRQSTGTVLSSHLLLPNAPFLAQYMHCTDLIPYGWSLHYDPAVDLDGNVFFLLFFVTYTRLCRTCLIPATHLAGDVSAPFSVVQVSWDIQTAQFEIWLLL